MRWLRLILHALGKCHHLIVMKDIFCEMLLDPHVRVENEEGWPTKGKNIVVEVPALDIVK